LRSGIITILFIIIVGVIIANMIANAQGTKLVLDSLVEFWRTSINGLLAKASGK
jgi:hypothetical protein